MSTIYLFCKFSCFLHHFRFKIPDATERLRQDSEGRTRASNLVFTIWAVFGGFILHFLLSNYLTVLLRPDYEEPVDTAADLVKRGITPFMYPGAEGWRESFVNSYDPVYQELGRRLVIAKDWAHYDELVQKVISTGLFADIGTIPWVDSTDEYKDWYRSAETLAEDNPYCGHLLNKKWPLKEVF